MVEDARERENGRIRHNQSRPRAGASAMPWPTRPPIAAQAVLNVSQSTSNLHRQPLQWLTFNAGLRAFSKLQVLRFRIVMNGIRTQLQVKTIAAANGGDQREQKRSEDGLVKSV